MSAIAIGLNAVSNGFVSVAIGNHANASISGSTAMGILQVPQAKIQ